MSHRIIVNIACELIWNITRIAVFCFFLYIRCCGLVSLSFKGICGCTSKRWPSHRHHGPDGGLPLTIRSCWFASMLETRRDLEHVHDGFIALAFPLDTNIAHVSQALNPPSGCRTAALEKWQGNLCLPVSVFDT